METADWIGVLLILHALSEITAPSRANSFEYPIFTTVIATLIALADILAAIYLI